MLRALLFVVISAAATIALIEALLSALLAFPARSPLLPLVQDLYSHVERDIIQFNPAAARWDPELFYTLWPGRFVFAQREFRHEFRVNRAGVRDDEASLGAPQIIALGDSFTMGWGVAQEEAYPKRIEVATGLRTLNAGVSSYGTVREMLLLDRLDTSRLRYLIVQYNGDDVFENLAYWRRANHHVSRSESEWRRSATRLRARRVYYPGKHTWDAARRFVISLKSRRGEPPAEPDAADLFLNALIHAGRADLTHAQLILWEMPDNGVTALLPDRVRGPDVPPAVRAAVIVDMATALDRRRDFWVLDDHLNASGHRVIAERLVATIRDLERTRAGG